MKPINRPRLFIQLSLGLVLGQLASVNARAQSGTWINTGGGGWSGFPL